MTNRYFVRPVLEQYLRQSLPRPAPAGRGLGMLRGLGFDRRKLLEPCAQVAGQNKRAATALHGAKLSSLDRLVELRTPAARDRAGLRNRICKRCVHFHLANQVEVVSANAPVFSRAMAI